MNDIKNVKNMKNAENVKNINVNCNNSNNINNINNSNSNGNSTSNNNSNDNINIPNETITFVSIIQSLSQSYMRFERNENRLNSSSIGGNNNVTNCNDDNYDDANEIEELKDFTAVKLTIKMNLDNLWKTYVEAFIDKESLNEIIKIKEEKELNGNSSNEELYVLNIINFLKININEMKNDLTEIYGEDAWYKFCYAIYAKK